MDLKTLLQPFTEAPITYDFRVKGISNHSRNVKESELFFAYKGTDSDGRAYLQDALLNHPAGLVLEAEGLEAFEIPSTDVPIILIPNLAEKMGAIASRYYADPSAQMHLIGVTGTNGKTTITYVIYQALVILGIQPGLIGTLGLRYPGFQSQLGLTTPDPIALQRTFALFKSNGVEVTAMEVTSHALEQYRTEGLQFDTAVFTNLTQDHLDYHQTMEAYGLAKQKLFAYPTIKTAILNAEDPYTPTLVRNVNNQSNIFYFSTQKSIPHMPRLGKKILVRTFTLSPEGISAEISTPWGEGVLESQLIGQFNLSNLLAATAVLCQYGFSLEETLEALKKVEPAMGRMQRLGGPMHPQVIVDYSHTPDSLQQALMAARSACKRKLWCVFGCGGDRDKSKRAIMGRIAAELADKVIVTNDNPRSEEPRAIIEDILEGIAVENASKVMVEENRGKAIDHAITHALSVDVILIAGKGHEDYQVFGDKKMAFSDIQYVKKLLGECA